MMPYEKLVAWQVAHQLTVAIYRVTEHFPKREVYGLSSQLRRAGFSVAANIAEGVAKRGSTREFHRFLDIAIGSLSEIAYALRLSRDVSLLTATEHDSLSALRTRTARLVWGLYRATRR